MHLMGQATFRMMGVIGMVSSLLSLFSPELQQGALCCGKWSGAEIWSVRVCVCVCDGGRIRLRDLILWKWPSSLMCQTLTGQQAEWSCNTRGSVGKLLSVMWVLHALCNLSFFQEELWGAAAFLGFAHNSQCENNQLRAVWNKDV